MESIGTSLSESQRGFLFGSILIFIGTFAWLVLAGSFWISEWTEYLVIVGILAQVLLIHRREQALYTSRRWRFWYALIIAGFACNLMTRHLWQQGHDAITNPAEVRGQLILGGLLLFYVMTFPLTLRLILRTTRS